MHVMLDLETLSTRTDAAIVQIGAVLFEPVSGGKVLNHRPFNRYVLVQDGCGSIDNDTLAWWFQQPNAARIGKELGKGGSAVTLAQALKDFVEWPKLAHDLDWSAIGGVWAKPDVFDIAVLKTAFARFGLEPPWNRRVTRDAQTVFAITGGVPEIDWTGLERHNAVDDCLGQIMQLQMTLGR